MKRFYFLLLIYALSSGLHAKASAPAENDLCVGISAGYSMVLGSLDDKFHDSFLSIASVGFYIFDWLELSGSYSYSKYDIPHTGGSYMASHYFSAGPAFSFRMSSFLYPYAGFSINTVFLDLNAKNIGSENNSFKWGYRAFSGFIFSICYDIDFRIDASFCAHSLSGDLFNTVAFTGGIRYRFTGLSGSDVSVKESVNSTEKNRADEKYTEALDYYKKGQVAEARKIFSFIRSEYGDYRRTGYYIQRIEELERNYQKAIDHLKIKNYYTAIQLLDKISECLPEAKKKLEETRAMLIPEKKKLERKAKELYYAEKYEQCIRVLKRVKLIDPSSRVVSLFLPRAKKRYRSYEQFK